MSEINAEFGLGYNLNAYRGVTWYTDAGASGTFDSTNIDFAEFYGKRKTAPTLTVVMRNTNCSGVQYACSGGTSEVIGYMCGTYKFTVAACVTGGSGNYSYSWSRTNTDDVDRCGAANLQTYSVGMEFMRDNEPCTITVVVTDTTYPAITGSCYHNFRLVQPPPPPEQPPEYS